MLETTLDFDSKELLVSNNAFGPKEIAQLLGAINEDFSHFGQLREAVQTLEQDSARTPASQTRLGVGLYLLGRFRDAVQVLSAADGGALGLFYQAKAYLQLSEYAKAVEGYKQAERAGYDADTCKLACAEATRSSGDAPGALRILDDMFGPIEQTADYLYQRGATVAAIGGNLPEAVKLYERAIQIDGKHAGALFGLALENDRAGNDDEALRLYERAASVFPTGTGVLLNLGIAYEDRGQYDRSTACYKRILDCYPEDERARLYLKDAAASGSVLYDEDAQRRNDRMAQLLNIPVANFQLSVRSRNCLQKMGVETLGDLTRTSEAELLASKNFGETSLYEIREMLHSRGLQLGQFAHEKRPAEPAVDFSHLSPDEQAMMDRPIADLNLSVRARKCMVRLGLNTIGELLRKTGDDLLECKNFGVTSLTEVREKLTEMGIKLRGD
jgi:DNA-directed RNA polymerase subunit alpha